MKRLVTAVSIFSAFLSALLFYYRPFPQGARLWYLRVAAGTFSALNAVVGALSALGGVVCRSPLALTLGSFSAWASARYVKRISSPHHRFEKAFGPGWEERVPPHRRALWLKKRWNWAQRGEMGCPTWRRDVTYAVLPGGRPLLADLWLPPEGAERSGLAYVYAHGSGWYLMDKDYGTRPFFRHLACQGHVVMDIAYRLSPETDIAGMVGDVKLAVDWMKTHAQEYGVDPAKVVLGGASAGGHLALLAAYTANDPAWVPDDPSENGLAGRDLSVRAVAVYYPPTDMEAVYYHTSQDVITAGLKPKPWEELTPREFSQLPLATRLRLARRMEHDARRLGLDKPPEAGAFYQLLGGHPDEASEQYRRFSPVEHVTESSPATLIIQGEEDLFIPLYAAHELHDKLRRCKVPSILSVLPQTDHAFDLWMPHISPAAQSALYDMERFLALMAA